MLNFVLVRFPLLGSLDLVPLFSRFVLNSIPRMNSRFQSSISSRLRIHFVSGISPALRCRGRGREAEA
jgi:hypothetical protein